MHSNGKSPYFVSHSQLEVSLESLLIESTGLGMEASLGATLSHYEENVWSPGQYLAVLCAIPEGSAGTLPFVQCLPYRGQKLKISKYSPADIVSQLLQWDVELGFQP